MIISSGQKNCYNLVGDIIPCKGTGQDGEFRFGENLSPRFKVKGELVKDLLTGLIWPKDALLFPFPMSWEETLLQVKELSRQKFLGRTDWRLPNRRELRSLLYLEAKNPVLEPEHPFENVFHGWYWTSTTAAINPRYAWNIHFGGGRMFYSRKDEERLLWPVAGKNLKLFATGQKTCFNVDGKKISCKNTGQDGEYQAGLSWPVPRFEKQGQVVLDRLTGLMWTELADLAQGLVTWEEAFKIVEDLNKKHFAGFSDWRLPNINELESLVDCAHFDPALPQGHPFKQVKEFYWSSTTSFYEPTWAWALYLTKGATGVGLKEGKHFYVWAVRRKPGKGGLK
ncbi:Lcl C-terminal domain-containing protein [Thermodesulfatator autotrophicus]|uniref:Lcl C-terminal domain-containing protein n=1 Tax=Thermodesulfatator autotrophicus TaxID=1795632 RepID=A0A177E987_9BACT|nr:DUF1566 domain-containing protein [Thermodesulfatator autotrophicus]OAG28517.1 hypothetical protein TH606_01420 [Thermodesulfatator autotrophicus]